ncbi:MAG TPA: hypothetical protein VEL03_17640 [Streptosporangiaceae bacterium]|nr:hypothetical protein [Streptosporangiaceae bacterium]
MASPSAELAAATAFRPAKISFRRRRQLMYVNATKRYVGPALYSVMQPGEQIIAGCYARTKGRRNPASLAVALVYVAACALLARWHLMPPVPLTCGGLALLSPHLIAAIRRRRHPVFLAVTNSQLICVGMSGRARTSFPVKVRFHVPIGSFQIHRVPGQNRCRHFTYTGIHTPPPGLRFTVSRIWRQDTNEVMSALVAAGVLADGLVPAARAELGSSYGSLASRGIRAVPEPADGRG